jgi:SAM-dependent methyltransferase
MAWWFAVVEAQHDIQNPTSAEKIRLLGERMHLGPGSHVLDVASGRGGPALVLAEAFGCRITCVEKADEFVDAARERVQTAGLQDLIEVIHADASDLPLDARRYDAALCLGATFVWGGLEPTVARLESAGADLITLIDSSTDDWDRYETLHWLALDDWLREHPDHPDARSFEEMGRRLRSRYVTWHRDLLGWAILVGRAGATGAPRSHPTPPRG